MEISDFSMSVLLSERLEDKLNTPAEFKDSKRHVSLPRKFEFPGRPANLAIELGSHQQQKFPKSLHLETSRGIALHSFANHELLALELMALCLIKFPNAPSSFRRGIYYTMLEEQQHCRLYISRMRELGVELGDVKVNRFFWDVMSGMPSPLDFITKMSLIFEQANLDYSLHFQGVFKSLGDTATADIMKKVYEDEIGHVAHGLAWYKKWDESDQPLFDSHASRVNFPLSLKWAKGLSFDSEGRSKAGFDHDYIKKIKYYQTSRGSVPDLYIFNPQCEEEYVKDEGTEFNCIVRSFIRDLGALTIFLAKSYDICLLQKALPDTYCDLWSEKITIPEVVVASDPNSKTLDLLKNRKIGTVQTWGAIKGYGEKFESPQGFDQGKNLFSKAEHLMQIKVIENTVTSEIFDGASLSEAVADQRYLESKLDQLLKLNPNVLLKSEFGSSGRGNLKVSKADIEKENFHNFISNTFAMDHRLIVEPWRNRICDFSIVGDLSKKSSSVPKIMRPICDHLGQYRGHYIGRYPFSGLGKDVKQYLYSERNKLSESLIELRSLVEDYLESLGYFGRYGIDFYLYRLGDGGLKLTISEINVRSTMGHVAEKLQKIMGPNCQHLWMTLRKNTMTEASLQAMSSGQSELLTVVPVDENSQFVSFLLRTDGLASGVEKLTQFVNPSSREFLYEMLRTCQQNS